MALTPGTRIGSYEITAQIGVGGMGEVYRARDSKLDRDVAIKVLPEAFAQDQERLARFDREAKTLAALNHPGIAHIYGIEDADGSKALVMELVEGPTLADRIVQGPIPVDEALPIAKRIAEALEAAHEQGIIHRDLKPANIKLRPDGTVKLLDFGLAKAMEPPSAMSPGLSQSPTITTPAMTQAGMILGTAAYMSPEQAKGQAADRRSDVWAFGAVLYETLTGQRAFQGNDVSDTMASVLKADMDWNAIPASVPTRVVRLIRRCLQPDRGQRLRDIGDVRLVLEGAFDTDSPPQPKVATALPWRLAVPAAVALLAVGYLLGSSGGDRGPLSTSPAEQTRFTVPVAGGYAMRSGYYPQLAVSGDGRTLVFASGNQLWSRALGEEAARPLDGTEGASQPFFSPDNDWIAFLQDGRLMRYQIASGAVTQLVDSSIGIIDGASWGEDDSIVIGSVARGLRRIQVGGSVLEVLATPIAEEGETAYVWPQSVDGGRAVIYTALGPSFVARDAKIVILDVASGARTVIAERGTYGRYLPSGHVVYVDSTGALMAVPFDIEQREVSPVVAVPVETGVRIAFWAGAASFGVSATGTLAFARGSNWENQLLEVVDRTGTTIRRVGVPLSTDTVTLSRDGRTVAVDQFGPDNADIYTYNVETGSRNRVTRDDAMEENGVISPDGSRIAYMRSSAGNVGQILLQSVEGNSQPKPVYEGTQYELPQSWSTDGKYLVISSSDAGGQGDILAIDVDDPDAAPIEIATTERDERPGDFSSDGRYFAFVADDDIVIRPFPALDADFVITDAISPRWTDDELFFVRGSTLMALPIATDPSYRSLGEPHSLFDLPILLSSLSADRTSALFSAFRDGQTFLIDVPNRDAAYIANEIWVVLNWFEALKARVPVP